MKDPTSPKLGLIFTTKWQWSYVIKGGASIFKDFEVTGNEREIRPVKGYWYSGFRIVRAL